MDDKPYHCPVCGYWKARNYTLDVCPDCKSESIVDLNTIRPQLPQGWDFIRQGEQIQPYDLYWQVWPTGGDGPAWLFAAALMGGPQGTSVAQTTDAEGKAGTVWVCRRVDGKGPEELAKAFLLNEFGTEATIA